jgi:hypothetical protein
LGSKPTKYELDKRKSAFIWGGEQAYENSIQTPIKVARCYNTNHQPNIYQVGEMGLCRFRMASSKSRDISFALLLRWSRPIIIAKVHGFVLLANPKSGVIIRKTHVSQLKPLVQ